MKRPALYYVAKAWLWLLAAGMVGTVALGLAVLVVDAWRGDLGARAVVLCVAGLSALVLAGAANDYIEAQDRHR